MFGSHPFLNVDGTWREKSFVSQVFFVSGHELLLLSFIVVNPMQTETNLCEVIIFPIGRIVGSRVIVFAGPPVVGKERTIVPIDQSLHFNFP